MIRLIIRSKVQTGFTVCKYGEPVEKMASFSCPLWKPSIRQTMKSKTGSSPPKTVFNFQVGWKFSKQCCSPVVERGEPRPRQKIFNNQQPSPVHSLCDTEHSNQRSHVHVFIISCKRMMSGIKLQQVGSMEFRTFSNSWWNKWFADAEIIVLHSKQ